jgi:hypothetical protein
MLLEEGYGGLGSRRLASRPRRRLLARRTNSRHAPRSRRRMSKNPEAHADLTYNLMALFFGFLLSKGRRNAGSAWAGNQN